MIYDKFPNVGLYASPDTPLGKALDFAANFNPETPDGKIEIDGANMYAVFNTYTTSPAEDLSFEAHRKHIDLQLLLSGIEDIDPELVDNAFFYYGIALLETGQIARGIDFVARILEKDPLNMRYQIGGLYALAKSDQWEEFLDISGGIIQKEKIKIDFEISDFSDIGHLILELFHHYTDAGKQDEAMMCQKILTHLIYTKIENRGETDNIMAQIEKIAQVI